MKMPTSPKKKKLGRGDIRNYFTMDSGSKTGDQDTPPTPNSVSPGYKKWCRGREATLRKQAEKAPFNEAIRARCKATRIWRLNNAMKRGAHMNTENPNDEKKKIMWYLQYRILIASL